MWSVTPWWPILELSSLLLHFAWGVVIEMTKDATIFSHIHLWEVGNNLYIKEFWHSLMNFLELFCNISISNDTFNDIYKNSIHFFISHTMPWFLRSFITKKNEIFFRFFIKTNLKIQKKIFEFYHKDCKILIKKDFFFKYCTEWWWRGHPLVIFLCSASVCIVAY